MKHISVLVPDGDLSLTNLEATYKIFTKANEALGRIGKLPAFRVQLVGASMDKRHSNNLFSIHPEVAIGEVDKTDLIIIPAVHGDINTILADNQPFIPWIIKQYLNGAEVASLCIGAFILARTGLLKGKNCATHWMVAKEFRAMYPEVNLVEDKIITDDQGLYTSGGAYSSLNLILYLLEKYAGREIALLSSKVFEIDIARNSQSPFIIFKGQKDHYDESVKKAQEFVESNYQEKITVEGLAALTSLGRRSFERRFKKATHNTVIEYIQRVKIEAAKKNLETNRKTIGEVMYEVGYTDMKAFRDVFKKITGVTPIEYRNKYNIENIAL